MESTESTYMCRFKIKLNRYSTSVLVFVIFRRMFQSRKPFVFAVIHIGVSCVNHSLIPSHYLF